MEVEELFLHFITGELDFKGVMYVVPFSFFSRPVHKLLSRLLAVYFSEVKQLGGRIVFSEKYLKVIISIITFYKVVEVFLMRAVR